MKNRAIITITDEGAVIVPDNPNRIRMTIIEIAGMFGVYYQTAKRHIRAVEKSGIADGDCSMTCLVDVHGVHPEYYGLDMIAALAFRLGSWQAAKLRRWFVGQATRTTAAFPIVMWNVPRTETVIS